MRMWGDVDVTKMCNAHLLGEHCEMHMFVGTINKGISIQGYLENNLVELPSLNSRHDKLADELKRRGMRHAKSLPTIDMSKVKESDWNWKMNKKLSEEILIGRCPLCRKNIFPTPLEI